MPTFLRFGSILLLIGRALLFPVTAHDFQAVEKARTSQESTLDDVSYQGVSSATLLDKFQFTQYQLGSNKTAKDQKDDSKFVPLISQRLINFAQHEPLHNEPDYRLAFEFIMPLAPSFTIGYRIDFAQVLDWSLQIRQTPSRLSAWKETNLLYRFTQKSAIS